MQSLSFRFVLFCSLFFILNAGCKPPKEECCYDLLYIRNVDIGFVGFDSTELKSLSLLRFAPNTDFQQPLDTVPLSDYSFWWKGDTARTLSDSGQKLFVQANVDLKLVAADMSTLHTITKAIVGAQERHCIEMDRCSPGSLQTRIASIQNIHVDEILTAPDYSFPQVVYLSK